MQKKLVTEKVVTSVLKVYANPWNPNKMDDFTYKRMVTTLKDKGLFGSIIVRENDEGNFEILDGEHRWKGWKELGHKEIPVENAGKMTDDEAKFWTIYFNNTKGKDDVLARAKILKDIEGDQQQLLPWTDEEIENQKALLDFDFDQFISDEEPEENNKPKHSVLTLTVPEDVYKAWLAGVEQAEKRGWDEQRLFKMMVMEFLNIVMSRKEE